MAKKKRRGKSAKEIEEISQRLYAGSSAPASKKSDDPAKGPTVSKEALEAIIERLHEKDPHLKRNELIEKAHQNYDKDRGENFGYQGGKDKENMEALTGRLFIANYVNRNVDKGAAKAESDKKVTKDELEAITSRLFIQDYANKNIVAKQAFYDSILNKKKADEKVLKAEEQEEAITRLANKSREPAECNKELRGKKTYVEKGIYGTYALVDPTICSAVV